MVNCELCGKNQIIVSAIIEGVKLDVCNECKNFGKQIHEYNIKKEVIKKNVIEELVVENYSELIKKSRESLKLNQEEFAKKLNQKLSFVSKIENGELGIDLDLAKKFEKILNIKLVVKENNETIVKNKSNNIFTIGDILKK